MRGGGRWGERGQIISYEESAGEDGWPWVGGGGLMDAASIRPSTHRISPEMIFQDLYVGRVISPSLLAAPPD